MHERLMFFILILMHLTGISQSTAQSRQRDAELFSPDSVVYQPGFFRWDENTVISLKDIPASHILDCQKILDHTNTDFNEDPESSIIIETGHMDPDRFMYVIRITQDTIRITLTSEKGIDKALQSLRKMKLDAEKRSPDYGLVFLECGTYWRRNF